MIASKDASGGRLHVVDPVADDHLGARIAPGLARDIRHELLREPDHLAVDLDHHRALDVAVLQHAPQHAAIARADDEHAPRIAMGEQRHMRQHLLVDELVALGDLDDTVEHHHAPMRVALEHGDILERALHARELALHPEALAPIRIKRLVDPAIGGHRHLDKRTAREMPRAVARLKRVTKLSTRGRGAARRARYARGGTPPRSPGSNCADRRRRT